MPPMTDEHTHTLAALAAGFQMLDNRTSQIEAVFGDSIIIPGNKINSIIIGGLLLVAMGVIGFSYMFYLIRPL